MQTTQNPCYRLLPLLLLIFIDSFSYFVVIPVLLQLFYNHQYDLLPLSTSMDTRNILTGITISLAPMAALFFSPFIGFASDQYGRKKTLLMCIACVIVGFALPIVGILSNSVALVLLGRLMAGIGSASQPIAQATVTDLCTGKNRVLYLSLIALMMTLALILGPLAGGELTDQHFVHWFSIMTPYEFAFGLSLINLLLILFCFKETKILTQKTVKFSVKNVVTNFIPLIKQYQIGLFVAGFFFLELGWSQYYQSISLYLQLHWQLTPQTIGLFNAMMGATMSFGLLLLAPLFLRFFSIKIIMRFSLLLVLIGLISCSLFSSITIQWMFANIVAIFTGCAYVSLVALIADNTDNQHHGLVMGYLSTALYLAWMLTAFDGGFLISWYEKLPLILAMVFLFIAVVTTTIFQNLRNVHKITPATGASN